MQHLLLSNLLSVATDRAQQHSTTQEPDVEIEYVSAPQDFESLSLDDAAAPAEPAAPSQPAASITAAATPAAQDQDADEADMQDADGLGTAGLGASAGLGSSVGLGSTAGLGSASAGLGMTPGLGADSQLDGDAAEATPGLGTIPAWAKAGAGFRKASEPQPAKVSEAERAQARLDLQRVLAHFTSAEELTGTAPVADEADDEADETAAPSKKVFCYSQLMLMS